jgi:hypothetical protein
MGTDSEVVVFGSPMAVGHVRPLMPLAARLVARGFDVIWAISGDPSEPASVWKGPLAKIGVTFIDLDAVAPFARHDAFPTTSAASVPPRVLARANDVAEGAAIAIAAVVAGRTVRCSPRAKGSHFRGTLRSQRSEELFFLSAC